MDDFLCKYLIFYYYFTIKSKANEERRTGLFKLSSEEKAPRGADILGKKKCKTHFQPKSLPKHMVPVGFGLLGGSETEGKASGEPLPPTIS